MIGRSIKCIISILMAAMLLSGLILPAYAEDTSVVFRYLVEPEYRPASVYDLEQLPYFSGNDGILRIQDDTGKEGLLHITGKLIAEPEYDWIYSSRGGFYVVSKNEKQGFLNKEGKEIIDLQFDSIEPFSEGLANVMLDEREGYIDVNGRIIIPVQYEIAHAFSNGFAMVRKDEKWGFIDKQGNEVVPLIYDWVDNFQDGIARVSKNDRVGYVDSSGVEVIPTEYDLIQGFYASNLSKAAKNGKMGHIDKNGTEIVPLEYDDVGFFIEGLAWVKKNGKYGFVDDTGRIVVSIQYDFVQDFNDELAMVSRERKYGFVDKIGCEVIPVQYDSAYPFSEGLACVSRERKFGFIDITGKEVIPFQFDSPGNFKNDLARIYKDGSSIHIDKSGNEFSDSYDYFGSFSEGLAVVIKDSKFGYIDNNLKEVIPLEYEATGLSIYSGEADFKNGLVLVQKNWKYGYINKTGKEIVPIIYDQIKPFNNGLATVYKDDRCGLVDTRGTVVLPIIFEEIGIYNHENVFVRLNNRVGIASVHGTKEIPDKYIDPGESFNLPKEQLDFVNDIDSMEKIFTGFAAGLSEDQKKYPVGTDRLTLFMEEAAARVLRSRVQDSVITINQEILSEHERKAESVKTNAERILSECGITLSRDLFTTAILEASASDRTEINIEASAANVQLDYVRVETPEYCIVLPRETLEINDPFSIVFMKEPNPAHGNTDEATPGSSILKQGSFQYTVSFSKPIQGMVKLLLPVLPGETEYQAVFASDGTIIPGKYNPANGWFQAGIKTDGTFIVKENRITFSDIDGEPEQMQQAISVLASKGIIKGTSQTEFSPGAGITRAQIAALIVRMLQVLNENEDGGFIDVNKEDWFFGAAGSAKKYGIMQGTGNNAFSPDLFITEDQAIVIAMRVLKEKMWYKRLNNSEDVFNNYFYNLVPSWAKEDVALAFREKLFEIEYGGSELRTYAPMSRGDFAVLLYRLFNRLW